MTLLGHCFKVSSLILATALTTSLGFSHHANAQQRTFLVDLNSRTATDLGTLGGTYTDPWGINDAGQAVGYSDTTEGYFHAFK